jgi:hypothetical protein
MCRNIKQLRGLEDGPSDEQLRQAALQYVRKVSGYRAPSKANAVAFEAAVDEIAESTRVLLSRLVVLHRPAGTVSGAPVHHHAPLERRSV